MAVTTTLKLPEQLKARITPLAEAAGKSSHAWMIEALEERVTKSEAYAEFLAEALEADREMTETGEGYAAEDVHAYLRAIIAGKDAKTAQADQTLTKLGYSARAARDLERLARFLRQTNLAEAEQTIPLIISAVDTLAFHPRIGRPRGRAVRELVISRGKTGYVALYRYDEIRDIARVLAIRHQRELGEI